MLDKNVINFKLEKVKNAIRNAGEKIITAIDEHGDAILGFVVVGLPTAASLIKSASRMANKNAELKIEKEKQFRMYDRSSGRYVYAKRALSANEGLEFDRRKRNGESASEILRSMGLLKR